MGRTSCDRWLIVAVLGSLAVIVHNTRGDDCIQNYCRVVTEAVYDIGGGEGACWQMDVDECIPCWGYVEEERPGGRCLDVPTGAGFCVFFTSDGNTWRNVTDSTKSKCKWQCDLPAGGYAQTSILSGAQFEDDYPMDLYGCVE